MGGLCSRSHEKMFRCLEEGNLKKVETYLERGVSIDVVEPAYNGESMLHVAGTLGDMDAVKFLLDRDAQFNILDNDLRTPLYNAAMAGHLDIVRVLHEKGANIEAATKNNHTPFMVACWRGHLDVVKYLKENNAKLDTLDYEGCSALALAVEWTHPNVVSYLKSLPEFADDKLAAKSPDVAVEMFPNVPQKNDVIEGDGEERTDNTETAPRTSNTKAEQQALEVVTT